jgi:hypothetical protein
MEVCARVGGLSATPIGTKYRTPRRLHHEGRRAMGVCFYPERVGPLQRSSQQGKGTTIQVTEPDSTEGGEKGERGGGGSFPCVTVRPVW